MLTTSVLMEKQSEIENIIQFESWRHFCSLRWWLWKGKCACKFINKYFSGLIFKLQNLWLCVRARTKLSPHQGRLRLRVTSSTLTSPKTTLIQLNIRRLLFAIFKLQESLESRTNAYWAWRKFGWFICLLYRSEILRNSCFPADVKNRLRHCCWVPYSWHFCQQCSNAPVVPWQVTRYKTADWPSLSLF